MYETLVLLGRLPESSSGGMMHAACGICVSQASAAWGWAVLLSWASARLLGGRSITAPEGQSGVVFWWDPSWSGRPGRSPRGPGFLTRGGWGKSESRPGGPLLTLPRSPAASSAGPYRGSRPRCEARAAAAGLWGKPRLPDKTLAKLVVVVGDMFQGLGELGRGARTPRGAQGRLTVRAGVPAARASMRMTR